MCFSFLLAHGLFSALSERLSDGLRHDQLSSPALSSPVQPLNDDGYPEHGDHSPRTVASSSKSCIHMGRRLISWLKTTWKHRNSSSSLEFHTLFALFSLLIFVPFYYFHALASNTKFGEPQSMTCRDMFWQIDPSQCEVVQFILV